MTRPALRSALLAVALAAGAVRARDAAAGGEAPGAYAEQTRITALVDRMKATDVEVRKAAVQEAKTEQDERVTSALSRALSDADADVRAAALEGCLARTEAPAKKAAATAVATRLKTVAEKAALRDEALRLIQGLHDLAQPGTLAALEARLGVDVPPDELAARLRAIANLPSKAAVEAIIDFRASGGRLGARTELGYRRRYAREAFRYATGVDVGPDPDAMRKWWKDNEKEFDFEAAARRRAQTGGGPKANPKDGTSADAGNDK
jgi:hypothetical protein